VNAKWLLSETRLEFVSDVNWRPTDPRDMKTRAKSSDNKIIKMHPFHILHCGLHAAANALRRGLLLNTIQTCCIDVIASCANNYAISTFLLI